MALTKILVLLSVTALVCGNDADDSEQKKRGAGKSPSLNAIPTGAQKAEYTYSIYPQSPQTSSSYQQQVPNSFYPTQSGSSYYQPASPSPEQPSAYPPQPQLNLIPPPSSSQFLPLNFVPNPGYQTKYQIVPTKSANGNIQLAFIQPSSLLQSSHLNPYSQSLFAPNPGQVAPQQSHQFSFGGYPQVSFGQPYGGAPSTMLLLAQPNPSSYNPSNLLYQSSVPNHYNYYPSSQPKYNIVYAAPQGSQSQAPQEYEKLQGPIPQNIQKEDNEINIHGNDYITPAESGNYKNTYVTSRTSYKT